MGITPEQAEIKRLTKLYKELPPKQFAIAQGLIAEAARLRVRLDKLWDDIAENGETELFRQGSESPYERERPVSRIYTATNKNYQTIIRQLNDMLPEETATAPESKLGEFLSD